MSARRSGRAGLALAAAAIAALLLGGCVGLPTDGSVSTEEIDPALQNPGLLSLPASPQEGATPEQILQGFILAGRGPQEGYRVAREFLTDDFRGEWRPNAGVIISNSIVAPVQVAPNTFEVSLSVVARVTASGNYTELVPPETTDPALSYTLEQEDGEWRISSAPDGTVVTEARFNNTFKPYELSFFDASGDFLVPDLRWFPDIPSTKDRIVAELLAGPSEWLSAGVLVTAFPTGTKQGEPVSIDAGLATVDLSSEVRAQSGQAKQRMLQQLTTALGALDEVRTVRITVGGLPLVVPEGGSQPERLLAVDPNPLGLADGNFGNLKGSTVVEVAGISPKVEALAPLAVSLGRDRDRAAVLSAAGAALVLADVAEPIPVDIRQRLIAPTLDVEGYLWSITADGAGGLLAFGADTTAHRIPLSLPTGARVESLDISRDGSRLLIAVDTPDGPQLQAWGIVRDGSLVPVRLGDVPLSMAVGDQPILDATWVDGVTVAVLSRVDGTTPVTLYELGGQATSLGSLTGGVGIAGGNGVDGIRVVDADGVLHRSSGSRGWQATSVIVSLLATQQ